jgi:hypothetical protein
MPLSKEIGTPSAFASDIQTAFTLGNSTTVNSQEFTVNNSLAGIKFTGTINTALAVTAALSFKLQYKDGTDAWIDDITVFSVSTGSLAAGAKLFDVAVPPSTEKRIYRIASTSAFNASAANIDISLTYNPGA